MGCATLLEGRIDDAPESSFQGSKISYWQQIGRLTTSQKSFFQAAKSSNISSAILQEVRFDDVQESRFQGAKCSNMGSALQQLGWFSDFHESLFYPAKR